MNQFDFFYYQRFTSIIKTSGKVRRESKRFEKIMFSDVQDNLLKITEENLKKNFERISMEQQASALTRQMDPVGVFNHLLMVIEKYFSITPNQRATYYVLQLIRDDDLLRCLLNLSIYLGQIEDRELLISTLKRLYSEIGPDSKLSRFEQWLEICTELPNKKKLKELKTNRSALRELMVQDDENLSDQRVRMNQFFFKKIEAIFIFHMI